MKLTINKMLRQIREGLQTTEDPFKRQWLLGAQSALMSLDCDRETTEGVLWDNQCNMIVGET